MKLYEYFAKSGFHTCLVTTFGVDFDAYENIVLARARGAGCHNNLLLADSRMLSLALDGNSSLPRHAGKLYTVTGAAAKGVFHPKIVLQLGKSGGRLTVSSANITSAGLAGNLEIAGSIECTADESGERQIVDAAFRYLSRFLGEHDPGVRQQIEWLRARTPWLMESEPVSGPVVLKDGSRAAFLTAGGSEGIARQFLAAIGDEKPVRTIIVSPYWDEDLAALHDLVDATAAGEAIVLIDKDRHIFPSGALDPERRVSMRHFDWPDANRFVHAKLVIVQTPQADHVLYGSANCTVAALGNSEFSGINEEASLYRVLPPNAVIERLGIAEALRSPVIDPAALPLPPADDPIPLRELQLRSPGHFFCLFDTLTWRPPHNGGFHEAELELLAGDGEIMPIALQPLASPSSGERQYRMSGANRVRPSFARIRHPSGSVSAPGIILVQDELRAAVRDARTKRVDAAIAALDGETDVGLWLLETLNDLEAAEIALRQGAPIKRQRSTASSGEENAASYNMLDYENFVAGRQLRCDAANISRDSFSGTNFSYVRSFLNRILALSGPSLELADGIEAKLAKAFDLGDDIDDASKAMEGGVDFNPDSGTPKPPPTDPEQARQQELRRLQQRRANRDQLIDAVAKLQAQILTKGSLTTLDLLRLRAMLMVILAAGWDGRSQQSNTLQVLRSSGDISGAWPRLLGKCLFAYFGGGTPPIRRLVIEDYYDQIPDDILECWAGCLWAMQAILEVSGNHSEYISLIPAFNKLEVAMYLQTGLREDEFLDARILKVFDALSQRFAHPLDLNAARIDAAHRKRVSNLRSVHG